MERLECSSLIQYVEESAKKNPENVALDFMGKKTKYNQLIEKIDIASKALLELGVKKGDVVCVVMPNMPQAIVFIYAANKIGAVVNMIHPLSSKNEIKSFVNRVKAGTVLVIDEFYDKIEQIKNETSLKNVIIASASEELPIIKKIAYKFQNIKKRRIKNEILWDEFCKLGQKSKMNLEVLDISCDPALILHSGGTTGKVKGVCLSNSSGNASALQMIDANPMLSSSDKFLSVMPIFHGNGLVIGVHVMLMMGACCVLIPRFTPESYARDLLKEKCNYMSGVPVLFERLIETDIMQKADLSFLKGVFSGADFLSVELERRINSFLLNRNSKVTIRQGYGMTEGVVATTLNPYYYQKEGSIGVPLSGVDVKIVEAGGEKELPIGETGEIVFSSETNMMYYYDDPEETAISMKKHSDGKLWIHSGDLGLQDGDGFFYFKGRIKRMIVKNGYNVFPNEVENIIETFDMVNRCCVVGVPDTEGTCKIKAYIVLKDGFTQSEKLKSEILNLCKDEIAKYAIPKVIQFIDEMPKTLVGKVDFTALSKM